MPLFHSCYYTIFGHSTSNNTNVLRRSAKKNWLLASRLLGSLKVIRIDTDRSATYEFPLVIRGNHGLISYRFPDKRRFLSKIAVFHPVCRREFSSEFCNGVQKLGSCPYQMVKRVLQYARSFRYKITIWRTDGRTDVLNDIALCMHSMLVRDKPGPGA